HPLLLPSFPTRRSSDLQPETGECGHQVGCVDPGLRQGEIVTPRRLLRRTRGEIRSHHRFPENGSFHRINLLSVSRTPPTVVPPDFRPSMEQQSAVGKGLVPLDPGVPLLYTKNGTVRRCTAFPRKSPRPIGTPIFSSTGQYHAEQTKPPGRPAVDFGQKQVKYHHHCR